MIIIEGTDTLGKTTLAQKLVASKELVAQGYLYRHLTRPPSTLNRFWGYLDEAAAHTVQDRFHMSEVAYSYARGDRSSPLSPEMYNMVDAFLRLQGAFTVVLTASRDLIERRFREVTAEPGRTEMYDLDVVQRANSAFRYFAQGAFIYEPIDLYRADSHFHIELTEDYPWVSARQVEKLLSVFVQFQNKHRRIIESRQPFQRPSVWLG